MIPRLEVDERLRPVSVVAAHTATAFADGAGPLPRPAPYAAVQGRPVLGAPRSELALALPGLRLAGWYDAESGAVGLTVTAPSARGTRTSEHRSRRHGRVDGRPAMLALALTGAQVTLLVQQQGTWLARARYDLRERLDTGPLDWSGLQVDGRGVTDVVGGGFGQLGLRDVRLVSEADGTPVVDPDGALWLTATSAGPGFFPTAHTSVWRLRLRPLPGTGEGAGAGSRLEHTGDLFFRRAGADGVRRVHGDHATHLVRTSPSGTGAGADTPGWLVATSTWADFDRDRNPSVRAVLARTGTDPRHGEHVLDADDLPLPTDGLRSVGVWDPHLVHTGEEWLVGYVSARRFFRFHPVLARGQELDRLTLAGAATDRIATEGTTLVRLPPPAPDAPDAPGAQAGPDGPEEAWRVLASDGRDGRRGQREGFPVLDLALAECGRLDAAYPTNLPWPTVLRTADGWAMVTFNGQRYGGELAGYGTHGDLVILREARRR